MDEAGDKRICVGVLSDTHGVIKPAVLKAFEGVDLIIHAGDVLKREVLDALERIAPVAAVRGNMDREEWCSSLPRSKIIDMQEVRIFVLHDLHKLDIDPETSGIRAVICGHTHEPMIEERSGVLYVNPGSAGDFIPTNTVAILEISGGEVRARLVDLN